MRDNESMDMSDNDSISDTITIANIRNTHQVGQAVQGLAQHVQDLLHCDVIMVCQDGLVETSSLIIGSISKMVYDALDSIQASENQFTVMVPDLTTVQLNALFSKILSINYEKDELIEQHSGMFEAFLCLHITPSGNHFQDQKYCADFVHSTKHLELLEDEGNLEETKNEKRASFGEIYNNEHLLYEDNNEKENVGDLKDDGEKISQKETKHCEILQEKIEDPFCKKMFKTQEAFITHEKRHTFKSIKSKPMNKVTSKQCTQCEKLFKNVHECRSHYKRVHVGERTLMCPEKGKDSFGKI